MLILLVSSGEAELKSLGGGILVYSLLLLFCESDFACLKGEVKLLIFDGVRDTVVPPPPPFCLVLACGSLLADIDR